MEGNKDLMRDKEIITNLFQDDNSEKLRSMLKNVREIEILYAAGDWNEISDVISQIQHDM